MLSASVKIINRLGLHARAAAKFMQMATSFRCEVFVEKGTKKINGKSIMGLMMLAASQDCELVISTEGEDEEAALQALIALIDSRFGEPE